MIPVNLQTHTGYEFYCSVAEQFFAAKKADSVDQYKQVLFKQRDKTERDILHFLNDEELTKKHKLDDNDESGWKYWKEESDKFTVLNYFYNRKG